MSSYLLLALMGIGMIIQLVMLARLERMDTNLSHPAEFYLPANRLLRYDTLISLLILVTWGFTWDLLLLPVVIPIGYLARLKSPIRAQECSDYVVIDTKRGFMKASLVVYAMSFSLTVFRQGYSIMNALEEGH